MTRYDVDQIGDDAVQAVSPAIKGPRGLARLWAAESRTLDPKYQGGLDHAPKDHPWLAQARQFLETCQADRVDPARVVAALFDYARVQKRRGRKWRPSLPTARSEFARRLYDEWEARQRSVAAGNPAARAGAARRLAESRRREIAPPLTKSRPGPTSALSGAVRRKVSRPVTVPKNLTRDPERTEAALLETLDRDAAAYLARAGAGGSRSERFGVDLAPEAVVELDPLPYSPTFRALVGCPLPGDGADPLVHHVLGSSVLRRIAVGRLERSGVPAELFG